MEKIPEHSEALIAAALEYLRLGYRPIPLLPGTKAAAVKWKPYQEGPPSQDEVRKWFSCDRFNIALVTGNGTVVVDVDDPGLVDQVMIRCGTTPMRTLTPRGGHHLWYRMRVGVHYGNGVKIRGKPLDMRCEGAYACVPWSRNAQGIPYKWLGVVLPANELPLLKVSWLRERKRVQPLPERIDPGADIGALVRRARAYLATVEGAVSGKRGHDKTFRAACILCIRFGLGFEQAWPLLKEWSEAVCEPPWSDHELEHKIHDALKKREYLSSRRA
jgi:hypothetical protein